MATQSHKVSPVPLPEAQLPVLQQRVGLKNTKKNDILYLLKDRNTD